MKNVPEIMDQGFCQELRLLSGVITGTEHHHDPEVVNDVKKR